MDKMLQELLKPYSVTNLDVLFCFGCLFLLAISGLLSSINDMIATHKRRKLEARVDSLEKHCGASSIVTGIHVEGQDLYVTKKAPCCSDKQ
jgi:hypothetical protein